MPVIKTDGGRLIDYPEGTLRDIKPKVPWKTTYVRHGTWGPRNDNHWRVRLAEEIPGYSEWYRRRIAAVRDLSGKRIQEHGEYRVLGLTREQTNRRWKFASRKALKEVEEIKKKIDLTEASEEALTGAITVLRGPVSAKDKLTAARLVLDFTMAKPVAKSEVTVSSAEDWLRSLVDKD